jgi:UTP--glucose-1-phosphate uridylyltransferase
MVKIKKVIFPVGGLGTRFLPATKSLPKEMLPVFNKPLIQHAFEEARSAGIEQFIFITGRNKNAINNHFDHAYELQHVLNQKDKKNELKETSEWLPDAGNVAFIRQQKPLGLGHAIWCARNYVKDEAFAVILADELLKIKDKNCLKDMINLYEEDNSKNIVGVYEVDKDKTNNYGIIDFKDNDKSLLVKDMIEKPSVDKAPSNLAIIGRYILQPEIFSILEKQEKGAGDEIQLTDAMRSLNNGDNFLAHKFTGQRFDCGSPMGFLEANLSYALDEDKEKVTKIIKKYSDED